MRWLISAAVAAMLILMLGANAQAEWRTSYWYDSCGCLHRDCYYVPDPVIEERVSYRPVTRVRRVLRPVYEAYVDYEEVVERRSYRPIYDDYYVGYRY